MGNSVTQNQRIHYNLIKKDSHPLLGEIFTVGVNFGPRQQQCLMKKRLHIDVTTVNRNIQSLMHQQNNSGCRYIFKKIYAQQTDNSQLCSAMVQQQIFFQSFQHDLKLQYYSRRAQQKPFLEGQIIKVLGDCSMALKMSEELNTKFYHISKQSILKNKHGDYQLILSEDSQAEHPLLGYQSQFDSQLLEKNYILAPQLLMEVGSNNYTPPCVKDQIFSLAGTILSLCLMREVQFESQVVGIKEVGGRKVLFFQQERLKRQVYKLRQMVSGIKYSQKLKCLLVGMLEFERDDRISGQQIRTILSETNTRKLHRTLSKKGCPVKKQKENLSTIETKKDHKKAHSQWQGKKIVDVYLDAKHLFEQTKTTIATDARHYKNAKLGRLSLQNIVKKQTNSEIKSRQSIATPIKQLRPFNYSSEFKVPYPRTESVKKMGQVPLTQSKIQMVNQNIFRPQSRTSLALNLLSKFQIDSDIQLRR